MTSRERAAGWRNPPWWYATLALPWLAGLALLVSQVHSDRAIAARERTTQGTITAHDPGNHDSYEYTYGVGDRTFRAWQIPSDDVWRLGQQVVVYYDPTDPAVSSLVEFTERSDRNAGPVPALLLGISGIFAFIYFQRRRARRTTLVEEQL